MTRRALVLEVAARALHPVMMIASIVVLLRGHHEPGGGFIGGLIAVGATALLAVARGAEHALSKVPLDPQRLGALGVALALSSGVPALVAREAYLTHRWVELDLGVFTLELGTTLAFDAGVYLAVFGGLGGVLVSLLAIDEGRTP